MEVFFSDYIFLTAHFNYGKINVVFIIWSFNYETGPFGFQGCSL